MKTLSSTLAELEEHQAELEYKEACFAALLNEIQRELQVLNPDEFIELDLDTPEENLAGSVSDFVADVYDLYQAPIEFSPQEASPQEIQAHCDRLLYHAAWLKDLLQRTRRELRLAIQELSAQETALPYGVKS